MQRIETLIHRQYAVTATTTCIVTADNGLELCTVHPGEQKIFTAISHFTDVSDNRAIISLLFGQFTENRTTDIPQPCHTGALPERLQAGHVYDLGELAEVTDLSALHFEKSDFVQTSEIWFTISAAIPSIIWPASVIWADEEPVLMLNSAYRFALRREPNGNLIVSQAYVYSF